MRKAPLAQPMVIRYEDGAGIHVHRHLLTKRSESVAIPVEGRLHWAWPNAEDVGFYQCNSSRTPTHHGRARKPSAAGGTHCPSARPMVPGAGRERSILEFLDAFAQLADVRHGTMRCSRPSVSCAAQNGCWNPLHDARPRPAAGLGGQAPWGELPKLGAEPMPGETDMTRERRAALLRAGRRSHATLAPSRTREPWPPRNAPSRRPSMPRCQASRWRRRRSRRREDAVHASCHVHEAP